MRECATWSIKLWKNPRGSVWYSVLRIHTPYNIKKRISLETRCEDKARERHQTFLGFTWKEISTFIPEGESSTPKEDADIESLVEWFIEVQLPVMRRADKTIKHYTRTLGRFVDFCIEKQALLVTDLTTPLIQEWQVWVKGKYGQMPIRGDVYQVRNFINACGDTYGFELKPIRWDIPKKPRSSRYRSLSIDELQAFLSSIKQNRPDLYDLVLWGTLTGWRLGDILDLKWSEIKDSPKGTVIDRMQLKTKNALLFPVNTEMKEVLVRQKKTSRFVFGEHRDVSLTGQKLCRTCDTLGIDRVCFRDLRKTFATHRVNSGTPPHILKELMGHETLAITLENYTEADLENMAKWNSVGIQSELGSPLGSPRGHQQL